MKTRSVVFVVLMMTALCSAFTANAWRVYRSNGTIHVAHGPCDWVYSSQWVSHPFNSEEGFYMNSLSGPCGTIEWRSYVIPGSNPQDPNNNNSTAVTNQLFDGNYLGKPAIAVELYNLSFNLVPAQGPQISQGVLYLGNCSWTINANVNGGGATLQSTDTSCSGGSISWTLDDPQASTDDINNYTFSGDLMQRPYIMIAVFDHIMNPSANKNTTAPQTTVNNNDMAGSWHIYPNPANDIVNLNSINAIGDNYCITNMQGQVMTKRPIAGATQQINIKDLPYGIYMLQIYSGNSRLQTMNLTKQ